MRKNCIEKTKAGKDCSRAAVSLDRCTQHAKIYRKTNNIDKEIKPVITITFGDVAENHARMQKIGVLATEGFQIENLEKARLQFESEGFKTELVFLNEALPEEHRTEDEIFACVLIVRNGANCILKKMSTTVDNLLQEQTALKWDTKAKMYGRVVNKLARHNLCYSDIAQEADYENGKGTIVAFDTIPCTKFIRNNLSSYLGDKAENLEAEGNLYYDPSKCFISYHGDSERKKVVAIRIGGSMPLYYQWFQNSKPVGDRINLMLNHGDLYIMNEKAVGNDWKKKKILTLRHAAGCDKCFKIKN